MNQKIIKKTKKLLKFTPNLLDYEKTYKTFRWEEGERELFWFPQRKINAAYNAVDRHALGKNRNKIALYWHGENDQKEKFTFYDLYLLSNQFGNFLKSLGVKRGERVFFFLPRIPELYWGFLGTLKIGAVAGTLFAAFGPQALFDRLKNSGAKILVTNKSLYSRLEKIEKNLPDLKKVVLVENLTNLLARYSGKLRCKPMSPAEPAFILYTSGTTGKPKGVVHTHQAILLQHLTAYWVLDLKESDIYWCTADPGWVTGIAYEILGNWSNGATTLVYEGRFNPEKWYQLIQNYRVTVWYTAPTAIRMLAAGGEKLVKRYNLTSLRHLASVGEPLNPEAVWWGMKAFGLPFHDNWWQTETGGILIANYPCMDIKPGSMGKPVPGITAEIVNDEGKKMPPGKIGNLAIKPPWPSMMKTIWRRPKKYRSYFVNNWYISGDLAYKDKDGYFWFVSRADDIIKTAGERVGPFEVESCLLEHPAVVEAGVIGKPDPLRGEIIKAFIVLKLGWKPSEKLKQQIQKFVKTHLAGHAYPREIEFIKNLPKTRSGKILRRLLKAKELGLPIGDTSTLEED
ncbi:MAG: acetate--CoA ligase [Microgenomates group bacterium]